MSIILKEARLTLAELAERENVHPATVWRWIAVGIRGVRLESISIGGRRVTSDQAFARWVSAQNGTCRSGGDGQSFEVMSRKS